MNFKDRLLLIFHEWFSSVYSKVRKKYIKNLPPTLLKSDAIKLSIEKTKADKFLSEIKEELLFAINNKKETESLFNVDKLGQLLTLIKKTEGLGGEIIELGTYKGGTTIMMARFLKRINSKRKIYTYDTFSGFPYVESGTSKEVKLSTGKIINKMNLFKDVNLQHVLTKFNKFSISDKVNTFQGSFDETLPKLTDEQFSFALVDCDIYDSALVCLKHIWPRMLGGGIMIFDDYNTEKEWGLKKAVDDFARENHLELHQNVLPYFIK